VGIDNFIKGEIEESIRRIEVLIDSGIFLFENRGNLFVKSAFIATLICLRDLLNMIG